MAELILRGRQIIMSKCFKFALQLQKNVDIPLIVFSRMDFDQFSTNYLYYLLCSYVFSLRLCSQTMMSVAWHTAQLFDL